MSLAGRSPCFVMCGDDICRDHGCRHVYESPPSSPAIPWRDKTAPDRVRPRECIANARDALNRAYDYNDAPVPLLIEAVDWLRRGLEQMAAQGASGGEGS